ncbi:AraC family transcriptional regulator (plasmid) [Phyllobacteriaceae bacterium JZ32]
MFATADSGAVCSGKGRREKGGHILDIIPQDTGPRLVTRRGEVAYSVRLPGSQSFLAKAHVVEITLAPVKGLECGSGDNEARVLDAPAGTVLVSLANMRSHMRWASVKESTIVVLEPSRLRKLDAADLRMPAPGAPDAFALEIAQKLKAALMLQKTDPEYVDGLITQMIIHLLHNGADDKPATRTRTELSRYNAKKVQAFMRENLSRKITVADLADVCGLSPSHFISAFTETFGQAPYGYLLNLRLAYAERLLAERDMPIAQVAYLSGFSSQSHLTSAMKKIKGATPSLIRNRK